MMIEPIPAGKKIVQISVNVTEPNDGGAWCSRTITVMVDKTVTTKDVLTLAFIGVSGTLIPEQVV